MALAYLYPEHLGRSPARVIQVAATVSALAAQGKVHLLAGRFAGLHRRLGELGLTPGGGLLVQPVWMCQPGPGLPVPFSWHGVYQHCAWHKLRRLARSEKLVVLVRHLKLAGFLLEQPPDLRPPLIYEAHEIFAQTAAEEGMDPARLQRLASLESRVLAQADKVVAISLPLAQALEARVELKGPVAVAPSGAGEAFFALDDDQREHDLVAYAGGLGSWKGVDLLLRAVALTPGARLELLGGQPGTGDWQRLAALAEELGIQSRLAMRPKAGQDAVRELLSRATVAVWPGSAGQRIASDYTSPLKLFEYLAAGCAVAAPRLPAALAVLSHGQNARLFAPDDPADLAGVLSDLLANPEQAASLGRAGRKLAQGYTWDARAQVLWNLARELAV